MRYSVDKNQPKAGYYEIVHHHNGYAWIYVEETPSQTYVEQSELCYPTASAALRSAAEDWDDNGHEGPRVGAVMRAAATRLEKKEAGV